MTKETPESVSRPPCPICSQLSDREYAMQKYGWPENDTHLPEAAGRLAVVRDPTPNASRRTAIRQCPLCRTYYLYRTDYEYLVNGSEDEEILTRLTDAEAASHLANMGPGA